ncbi:A/G-specific adenine glycosylase [Spinactinospora alkalitolerans]|uniref:Adenine DNA glycosylase n=1 Tax=Spinactinospora alkalitolerans TaxID=687207 RepID=A0A852U1D5_9ACTN|nr:A/G-specific adenine glycosylase [Spinactinospora alkalitolerans]NYE49941.1 A/G-specific adenine glycosylase [Spinactinospora alkalitolerans]
MNENPYSAAVLAWYEANARDLPWRRADTTPWGVLVSEVMLQQTPVARVLPAWEAWMRRWPTPADLAAEPAGEAVRMWNRLGYPRRALNLHACARAIVERHGGRVPDSHADLLALPGVGAYTSAAVAGFAFGQRHAILDTNVRRVLARVETGVEYPPKTPTRSEARLAESLLPPEPAVAARWGVAVMELGALVCTARSPKCAECPVIDGCAWVLAGRPAHDGPPRRGQTYAGTDRQVRGRLLAVLRDATGPVPKSALDAVWDEPVQRERALDALVADGLVDPLEDGDYALPA